MPVCSIDLLPTLLEMAGLPVSPGVTLDGLSLIPLLTGSPGATLGRDALFWHYPHSHRRPPASSVREGDLKLIHFYEDDRRELYDLNADPGETRDLAARLPAETLRLGVKLDAWLAATNARLPRPNPRYRPWLAAFNAGRHRAAAHWGAWAWRRRHPRACGWHLDAGWERRKTSDPSIGERRCGWTPTASNQQAWVEMAGFHRPGSAPARWFP